MTCAAPVRSASSIFLCGVIRLTEPTASLWSRCVKSFSTKGVRVGVATTTSICFTSEVSAKPKASTKTMGMPIKSISVSGSLKMWMNSLRTNLKKTRMLDLEVRN